ncbi:MAG: Arc family DNA-binding protein [Burkholderiales bacterium]
MPVDMLIKKMPLELKEWVASEAREHRRSLNQEVIALLEKARSEAARPARGSDRDIQAVLDRYRALPTRDPRSPDEILGYGDGGLPA